MFRKPNFAFSHSGHVAQHSVPWILLPASASVNVFEVEFDTVTSSGLDCTNDDRSSVSGELLNIFGFFCLFVVFCFFDTTGRWDILYTSYTLTHSREQERERERQRQRQRQRDRERTFQG